MNAQLIFLLAKQHEADLHRAAERARIASRQTDPAGEWRPRKVARLSVRLDPVAAGPAATARLRARPRVDPDRPVTIRRATSADHASLREIAHLDSQVSPSGPLLAAEICDEIVAAIAIDTARVIANPFRRTADAVALLRLRADQLTSAQTPSNRVRARLSPRNAAAEA